MLNKLFKKKSSQVSFLICEKEYESPELKATLDWFKDDGWTSREKSSDVVGSQAIDIYEVTKNDVIVQLVFETYEGVTLFTSPEHEHLFSEIRINT